MRRCPELVTGRINSDIAVPPWTWVINPARYNERGVLALRIVDVHFAPQKDRRVLKDKRPPMAQTPGQQTSALSPVRRRSPVRRKITAYTICSEVERMKMAHLHRVPHCLTAFVEVPFTRANDLLVRW